MKPWNLRPVEVRNLFNPAFCGLVVLRSIASYEEEIGQGMPFSLSLLVLPLCLHADTRRFFPKKTKAHLLRIVEENPEIMVGFANRVATLLPFTLEGLGLAMHLDCITVEDNGSIRSGLKRPQKKIDGTPEVIACQHAAAYLGRAIARINDRVTIYRTFGIRP